MNRTAVVLMNLGGPDSLEAVAPFLFNLFNDRAIINVPQPMRWMIAKGISWSRAKTAREIYETIGGKSPLLENTKMQARALEKVLKDENGELGIVRVFVAMRYWDPFIEGVVKLVRDFGAERIILLPLYPQYSSTTTGSALKAWKKAARREGVVADTTAVCCYPELEGFIEAMAARIRPALADAGEGARLLFSAHGLPERVIAAGDPYQAQIERTTTALVRSLGDAVQDWRLCYQSRVGPLTWIGPATPDEIRKAGEEKRAVVMVPLSFVSEHSETLYEIEQEYRALAREVGVRQFFRVATVGTAKAFIRGLGNLVNQAVLEPGTLVCAGQCCGDNWKKCPQFEERKKNQRKQ